MDIELAQITESDIPELTAVMTRAFDDNARKERGVEKGGPPGYDNGDFFRQWLFGQKNAVGYKAVADGRAIGGMIVFLPKSGRNHLGTIFVDPAFQDKGVGTRMWRLVEQTFPKARSWQLDTPGWCMKNRHFYESKCGFVNTGTRPDTGPNGEKWETCLYRKDLEKRGRR